MEIKKHLSNDIQTKPFNFSNYNYVLFPRSKIHAFDPRTHDGKKRRNEEESGWNLKRARITKTQRTHVIKRFTSLPTLPSPFRSFIRGKPG